MLRVSEQGECVSRCPWCEMVLLALLISVVLPLGPFLGIFYPPLSLRSTLVIITFQLILSCHHQLTGTQAPLCPSAFSGLFLSSQAPSMFMGHIPGLIAHAIFDPWRRWQEVLTQLTHFVSLSILSKILYSSGSPLAAKDSNGHPCVIGWNPESMSPWGHFTHGHTCSASPLPGSTS